MKKTKQPYVIIDWAGNLMNFGCFTSFDDAEAYLCEKLGDEYDADRGEYEITRGDHEN